MDEGGPKPAENPENSSESRSPPQNTDWPTWASPEPTDSLARPLERARFLQLTREIQPGIADGAHGMDLAPELHDQCLDKLLSKAQNGGEAKRFARWWDTLIAAGNRDGRWKIAFPAKLQPLPPIRAPIVRRDMQLLHAYRSIEDAFFARFERESNAIGEKHLPAATFVSAIMVGGLVTPERVAACRARWSANLLGTSGSFWLPMTVSGPGKESRESLWFPDALTCTMWTRLQANRSNKNPVASSDPPTVEASLRELGLPPWPYTEPDFFRAAQTAYRLEVPGFIASYLSGEVSSQSLTTDRLSRLAGWSPPESPLARIVNEAPQSTQNDDEGAHITGDPISLPPARFVPGNAKVSQERILIRVSAILAARQSVQSKLDALVEDNPGGLWPITLLLIQWVKWLLNPAGARKRVAESTARTYFLILSRRLLAIAGEDEVLDYEPEDFETFYEAGAANIRGTDQRARFWGRALLFHEFLFLRGAPDVTLQELDGYVGPKQARVSANLVSEREFALFTKTVLDEYARTGDGSLARVYLIGLLGYRLGLRRREAQMIRLHDIHTGPHPILIVRPSRLAALKTYAARRQLPLRVLLSPVELDFFEDYVARRREQVGEGDGLLFAHPDAPSAPIPVEQLFDPVTALFSAICGDGSMPFRYHHLRHSFANWLLVALLASDEPRLLDGRPAFVDSWMFSPEQLRRIREGLFPRLDGTQPHPSRRHLYQVAALMGHLSPATTMRCYLHIIDWLSSRELDLALDRRLDGWNAADLGRLCGLSRTMSFRPSYASLATCPSAFMRRYVGNRLPPDSVPKPRPETPSDSLTQLLRDQGLVRPFGVLTSMTVLRRLGEGTKPAYLERAFGIPAEAFIAADRAYTQLYAKQSSRETKRTFKLPYEPRSHTDRAEFWRIARASERSFSNPEKRMAMVAAAEALIRRTGPRIGHLRFGDHPETSPQIASGLISMGIDTKDLELVIQHPASGPKVGPEIESAIRSIASLGIASREATLDWNIRKEVRSLLRLDINTTRKDPPFLGCRWGLRVAALNYVAVWIRMIATCARSGA